VCGGGAAARTVGGATGAAFTTAFGFTGAYVWAGVGTTGGAACAGAVLGATAVGVGVAVGAGVGVALIASEVLAGWEPPLPQLATPTTAANRNAALPALASALFDLLTHDP
jgi:hypothetical protein